MRVATYFNLHKKLFSIRAEEGPAKGKVIAHADRVLMHFCTLSVGKAGNAKVRREGRKNVHAFIRGELSMFSGDLTPTGLKLEWSLYRSGEADQAATLGMYSDTSLKRNRDIAERQGIAITYDPYRDTSFVAPEVSRIPISMASTVYLGKGEGVYALGATSG